MSLWAITATVVAAAVFAVLWRIAERDYKSERKYADTLERCVDDYRERNLKLIAVASKLRKQMAEAVKVLEGGEES